MKPIGTQRWRKPSWASSWFPFACTWSCCLEENSNNYKLECKLHIRNTLLTITTMKLSPRVVPGALHSQNRGACDWWVFIAECGGLVRLVILRKNIILFYYVLLISSRSRAILRCNNFKGTAGGGGRKGGPKTAKPHRNTPKNRKPHRIFSRIPKPRVHVGHNMKADISKTCDIFW